MKKATTVILLVIFAVLIGVVVYLKWNNQANQKELAAQKDFLPTFSAENVTTVRLTMGAANGANTTVLEKRDDQWVVASAENAPAADTTAINTLLSTINTVSIRATVSRSKENAAQYGLDEGQRLQVTVEAAGSVLADFFVGKNGSAPQTFYAALAPEGQEIYLVAGGRYQIVKDDWKAAEESAATENNAAIEEGHIE